MPCKKMLTRSIGVGVMLGIAAGAAAVPVEAQQQTRNIVLVHGAWADGSGWKGVYDELIKKGYRVSIVQQPLTSFSEDVAAVRRILSQQDGPTILVAHSYGGSVITEAGTDPIVAGLVYVAAHMPDAGRSEAEEGKRFPSALNKSTAVKRTPDGFDYLEHSQFREYFAADLPADFADGPARPLLLRVVAEDRELHQVVHAGRRHCGRIL